MSLPSPPPGSPPLSPPLYRDAHGIVRNEFGTFRGRQGDGVFQYLGIRYAEVKDQLSAPTMIRSYDGVVDATEYGPRAPAMDASKLEQEVMIQKVIDEKPSPRMSGTECLNLNITVPDVDVGREMPVLVWVHGGGYIMGGNHLPHWDPARLVKLSAEIDIPVIVVSINYRLALLGNLTSTELRVENYPGNNSLRDQRCALQWVRTHIKGFGGDPGKVTAIGVSAGAVSVLTHLYSRAPLFKQGIAMSGTPLMLRPHTLDQAESSYKEVINALGLENASVEERIQYLINMTPEDLVAKTPLTIQLLPFIDGALIPHALTFESFRIDPDTNMFQIFGVERLDIDAPEYGSHVRRRQQIDLKLPGEAWCEDLMLGDCQSDGNVFVLMGLSARSQNLASALYTSFTHTLNAECAEHILGAYSIHPDTPDDAALTAAIKLGTDIAYYAPALAYAGCYPRNTHLYHFNEVNPWNGLFKNLSSHYLDAVYLFQNFNEHLSEEGRGVARLMGRQFVAFANGMAPWGYFKKGGRWDWDVGVYGGDGVDKGRRGAVREILAKEMGLEGWREAWEEFLKGN